MTSYPVGSVGCVDDLTSDRWHVPSALSAACDFLDDYLAGGAKPSLDVYAGARQAKITRATLRRAAQKLRVKRTRQSATGPWFMYLPTVEVAASPRKYSVQASTGARARTPPDVDDENGYDDDEGDGYDVDRKGGYESARAAGGGWGWIVATLICGLGGAIFLRGWFGRFPVADQASASAMPPSSGRSRSGNAPARRVYKTPPRASRTNATTAPYQGDDPVFSSDTALDETWDDFDRMAGRNSKGYNFRTFPSAYDFAPE